MTCSIQLLIQVPITALSRFSYQPTAQPSLSTTGVALRGSAWQPHGAWIPCRCAFAPLSVCQINESVNESQSIKVARDPGDKTAQWLERWAQCWAQIVAPSLTR